MAKPKFAILFLCLVVHIIAQENADTNVAKSLRECYNNTQFIDSNKKRPMTMNYLIDLIRKVENGPDRMDIQKLSTSMLHRFRQDGILKATNAKDSSILPFSPYGDENKKFKILLHHIVPNSYLFPNDTLSPMERCTIHLMLSESVETIERGDEIQVCSKTGRYRLRTKRDTETADDIETFIPSQKQPNKGNIQQTPDDVAIVNNRKATEPQRPLSTCPLEYGVVYTKWGAVSAGSVIAGIAAGSEYQEINIKQNFETDMDSSLNNIFGATLAGNIAESAYLAKGNYRGISVGADGSWDSTEVPHGYYLAKNDDYYYTDAEIRGDLDGLILGTEIKEKFKNSARSMKLSQLLDMYYSERGVFNMNLKACRRKELLTEYASSETIEKQGLAFALILNKKVTLMTTMSETAISGAVQEATQKFSSYVPALRDLSCMNNNDYVIVRTEIMIMADFSFQYESLESILHLLLDSIDINPYNSNYTIVNAQTGDVIIESSNSVSLFHTNFNKTLYDSQGKGFDLSASLASLERLTAQKLELERNSKEPTSRSFIGLLVANNPSAGLSNKDFAIARVNDIIRPKYPDLRLLAVTASDREFFNNIVKDTTKDVVQIQDNNLSENVVNSIGQLVTRVKQIPSRIVSYKCTVNWTTEGDDKTITQYITPKSINYYRVSPNYFYQGNNPRVIKIRGQGQSALTLCHSRSVELPKSGGGNMPNGTQETNTESQGVVCKQVTSEGTIELSDPCYDVYTIGECAPLYFSVELKDTRNGIVETCTERNCRFTDQIKYTISTENFGCNSLGNTFFINIFVLISMLFIIRNIN